jgi:copper(I)-binding protein
MNLFTQKIPVLLVSAIISQGVNADGMLEIDDAWLAEAPPVSKVMAAYMEIENESPHDRKAVALHCAGFQRTEFHRTIEKDGMARMEHQQALNIPANSTLELTPGGYHVMLFNPANYLVAGDSTDCSMKFDDGTTIDFELDVKKPSDEDHSHHHHH